MTGNELIPHLFRREYSKIVSVLCRKYGWEKFEWAEDIAGDTFVAAFETWPYKGIPDDPTAWLYVVAKNKAKNSLKRDYLFQQKISSAIATHTTEHQPLDVDLSNNTMEDSQLAMLFAICHPIISAEAQIGLALQILCGFSIGEIANAFMTSPDTINKRLYRARDKLRQANVTIRVPSSEEIADRIDRVLIALYLLFNEGYHSESYEGVIREDLCLEAMRLTHLLLEKEFTNKPSVNALMALMCFQSSRFAARKNARGELILYDDQDQSQWNQELIDKGIYFLHQSAHGHHVTNYHLEAHIAYWYTVKEDKMEKWSAILDLFNQLLVINYSPMAALNRTYALAKVKGNSIAIAEAEKLALVNNPYYYVLLGELYAGTNRGMALEHFTKALALAKTELERKTIQLKLERLS